MTFTVPVFWCLPIGYHRYTSENRFPRLRIVVHVLALLENSKGCFSCMVKFRMGQCQDFVQKLHDRSHAHQPWPCPPGPVVTETNRRFNRCILKNIIDFQWIIIYQRIKHTGRTRGNHPPEKSTAPRGCTRPLYFINCVFRTLQFFLQPFEDKVLFKTPSISKFEAKMSPYVNIEVEKMLHKRDLRTCCSGVRRHGKYQSKIFPVESTTIAGLSIFPRSALFDIFFRADLLSSVSSIVQSTNTVVC